MVWGAFCNPENVGCQPVISPDLPGGGGEWETMLTSSLKHRAPFQALTQTQPSERYTTTHSTTRNFASDRRDHCRKAGPNTVVHVHAASSEQRLPVGRGGAADAQRCRVPFAHFCSAPTPVAPNCHRRGGGLRPALPVPAGCSPAHDADRQGRAAGHRPRPRWPHAGRAVVRGAFGAPHQRRAAAAAA